MLWDRKSIHTIHCFGDSLTEGYGALPGAGWVEVLAKRHPEMGWYNHGHCGALTEDILDALEGAAALARPGEGFFFMGGTNDILCGFRLSSIEARVKERLSLISEKVPLAIGIPPLATKESIWSGWQSEAVYERNQADLAAYGDFLLQLSMEIGALTMDFSCAFPLDDAWYYDGLHPNGKGYERFAELAEKVWMRNRKEDIE